ncbi:hypothetical protein FSP39_000496 [Pinctada imbricata]|uniref:Uncharacterized protein n=1 Tax=Pinctada imbricata TaxID=66713 RepID=A0AA88XTQ5_PINIB|nr:hypothetical protein FSP39_000496 [Pinctada imbricata]
MFKRGKSEEEKSYTNKPTPKIWLNQEAAHSDPLSLKYTPTSLLDSKLTKNYITVELRLAPILDYCSGIWGFSRSLNIESVQHRALRYFLGVHRFTPILSLQGESGWVPAYCRHQLNAIRFWNRLITMSDDRLTKKVFVWDKEQSNRSNWSNNMKRLFDSLDLADVYDNCAIYDLAQVESRIYRNFVNTWHEDLQNISKLRTYRVIKHDFQTEPYIIMDLPKPERSVMAMLRCGILPLRIETGRYSGEPVEERICNFCDKNDVEDERHFIFHCSLYETIRNNFLVKIESQNISTFDDNFFS